MLQRGLVLISAVMMLAALPLAATTAEMYFSSDSSGGTRVTNVQEGAEVWICIYDPDENVDCDVRDKIWTDVKLIDPKTGAYIVWKSYVDETGSPSGKPYDNAAYVPYKGHFPGNPGWLGEDYLEETGADTGIFVSTRPFQIGTRESFSTNELYKGTHVVDVAMGGATLHAGVKTTSSGPTMFKWGNYSFLDLHNETKGGLNADGDYLYWVGYKPADSIEFWTGLITLPLSAWILPSELDGGQGEVAPTYWLIGRFENMDTLIGMVQDQNDETDVAVSMMKIVDTKATITWEAASSRGDTVIYKDGNEAATVRVVDPDENLNCNRVEYVPVFIIVNPGSWNPANSKDTKTDQTGDNANNFCMLKHTGGIDGSYVALADPADSPEPPPNVGFPNRPIRWFNIYNAEKNDYGTTGAKDGRYYIQYPKLGVFKLADHGSLFDTKSANGVTAVSFYAQETGVNTGIFELRLNSILADLGFNSLNVNDVLVAYYLDPNDEDDFTLTTAYIGSKDKTSQVSFTDALRADKDVYWLGRDAVYVQVIDSNANVEACCPEQVVVHICDPHDEDDGEFWTLDETSSNSSIFFSNAGMELRPVWDPLGVGSPDLLGGYQLVLDNWRLEAYNEDSVYVRYNDVAYVDNNQGMLGLGDEDTYTAYSGPRIDKVRVSNDVSFDLMSIADTQVYNGSTTRMHFLDRNGNEVDGYLNSDCVFLQVIDDDQDEDLFRRERIDGFWDEGQNLPFGPMPLNEFDCTPTRDSTHPFNVLLGDTNIFNNSPNPYGAGVAGHEYDGAPRVYVLNPRSGRWAGLDLLETSVASGTFVSVICVDLVDVYACVPALGVLPGDTIVAFYMDPSNHSDSAMISIKVAIGGGTTTAGSSTAFIDAAGDEVTSYVQGDPIRVRVTDLSHTQDTSLSGAVVIDGVAYDLTTYGSQSHMFVTDPLVLDTAVGDHVTATYTDPTDPTDTSSATVVIVSGELNITAFYAGPNPFDDEVAFAYEGSGVATTFSVEVYDLAGHLVWARTEANVSRVTWTGTSEGGEALANGAYIYVLTATDGTNTFNVSNTESAKGIVFVNR